MVALHRYLALAAEVSLPSIHRVGGHLLPRQHKGPQEGMVLVSECSCLVQLAESWLLRLLLVATQRQLSADGGEEPQGGDAARTVALLPALPEDSAQSTPDPADLGFRC